MSPRYGVRVTTTSAETAPEYFDTLFDGSASVDQLLGLFRPDLSLVRLVRENDKKEPYHYRRSDGGLDVAGIGRDFADGYTIVLESIHRYVRAIASLLHAIEVELNFATQVNAYFTPPESQGFVPHYDEHDVLITADSGIQDLASVRRYRCRPACGAAP